MSNEKLSNKAPKPSLRKGVVSGSGISWQYFFGGGKIPHQEHYYKATVNGFRVEKHTFRGGVEYSVGNMDDAKCKYKTEKELLDAITPVECLKCQPGMPCPFCNGSGFLMPDR
jgi:hypothetical protein